MITLCLVALAALPVDRSRAPAGRDLTPVRTAELEPFLSFETALHLGWANQPLVVQGGGALVAHRFTGWLAGSIALHDRLRFGFEIPAVLGQQHDPAAAAHMEMTPLSHGLADPRLEAAGSLLPRAWPVAVAVLTAVTLPASMPRLLAGERGPTLTTELAASSRFGRLLVAANTGAVWRSRATLGATVLNDQIVWGASATVEALPRWRFGLGVDGATAARRPWKRRHQSPVELTGLAGYELPWGLEVVGGGGMGLSGGFGTPDLRLLAGVRFAARVTQAPRQACAEPPCDVDRIADIERLPLTAVRSAGGDEDGDGLPNWADTCPNAAETIDGVDDYDGCPEELLDSDGDAMLDTVDLCRMIPEDVDGDRDDDGCPEQSDKLPDPSAP